MSLFRPQRRDANMGVFVPNDGVMFGARGPGGTSPTPDQSMRVSAVWACLRLRSELISTMPVDVFRTLPDGRSAQVPKPLFFGNPSKHEQWHEWVAATQRDLDRFGNSFGIVTQRDGLGWPAQIEITNVAEWQVRQDWQTREVEYRWRGQLIPNADVWHERQHVVAGFPLGLSPVAYAAWTLQHALSAQEFAVQWFTSGAAPTGVLKNVQRTVKPDEAREIKRRFRAATADRGVFVAGADWEFSAAPGAASDARFLDAMSATAIDVCRFFGVPADMIDAEAGHGAKSMTYANIAQRNLQLLVMNLGPVITSRELTWSRRLVPNPRFIKLNTAALLRMDEKSKTDLLASAVDSRLRTPDEARELLDLPPLTEADAAQFDRLFGKPRTDAATPQTKESHV